MLNLLRNVTVFVFGILCVVANVSAAEWSSPPVPLIPSPAVGDTYTEPAIEMDGFGNALAVWKKTSGLTQTIQAASYTLLGNTWSAPTDLVTVTSPQTVNNPQINSDSQNLGMAVWEFDDGSTTIIQSSKYDKNAMTWGSPVSIFTGISGQNAANPQIGFFQDVFYAVWQLDNGSNTIIQGSSYNTIFNSWSAVQNATTTGNATNPQIANRTAIWQRFDGANFLIESSNLIGTWSTPTTAITSTVANNPQIGLFGFNQYLAVWEGVDLGLSVIQYAMYNSDTNIWTTPASLVTGISGTTLSGPQLKCFFGDAIVAWVANDGSATNIQATVNHFNSWSTPTTISVGGGATAPSVALQSSLAFVVWQQSSTIQSAVSKLTPVSWNAPVTIGTAVSSQPAIAANSGTVGSYTMAIWSNTAATANILSSFYNAPYQNNSSVTANPSTVKADGVTASTITLTLLDINSEPVVGELVLINATNGNSHITPPSQDGLTDSQGQVQFSVTDTTAETVNYNLSDIPQIFFQTSVTFSPITNANTSTVVANPTSVNANGSSSSTITVTLKAANNAPVSNHTVTLQQTGSSIITPSSAVSNASGVAQFTVVDSTIETVTYTAKDTTDNITIVQTTNVTFTPFANANNSTLTANPLSVLANGMMSSAITATLLDSSNNPVPNKTVSLSASGGSSVITPSSGTSNASGVVAFSVTDTNGEVVTYTAHDTTDNVTVAQQAQVSFVAVANATNSTVAANPTTVVADGTATSTITVTLLDNNNQPVPNKTVSLSANGGSSVISAPSGPSNSSGVVTFTVKDANAETVLYTAVDTTDGVTITQKAQVTFIQVANAANSTVAANPTSVFADGSTASTITVTLLDNNNQPVPNKTVSLSGNGGSSVISTPSGPSNSLGVVTFTVTDTNAETVLYTAVDATDSITITQKAQVTFIQVANAANSTVVANPIFVAANGTTTSTITVTLLDNNNQPVPNKTVSLSANGGSSIISAPSGLSNSSGVVTFTVKDSNAESILYTAVDTTDSITITQKAQVTFIQVANATNSTVTAAPTSVFADGVATSTITVTLLDNNNQPVPNKIVSLSANGGSSVISAPSGPSNSSGVVSFTVTDIHAETVLYTAVDATDGLTIAQQAQVTFIQVADATNSTVTANPKSVTADGIAFSTITVTLLDNLDQPVPNKAVSLSADGGSSVISPPSGPSDISGQVFFTVRDTVMEMVTYTAEDATDNVVINQEASVTFIDETNPALSTIKASSKNVNANGSSFALVTVTLIDGGGQVIPGHVVTLNPLNGHSVITVVTPPGLKKISANSGISNDKGQVTFKITDTFVETVTYSATDETDDVTLNRLLKINFVGFTQPSNFRGKTVKNEFATQTQFINVLKWDPAPNDLVVGYRIYEDGVFIMEVPTIRAEVYNIRPDRTYHYALTAVDANGFESVPLTLTLP